MPLIKKARAVLKLASKRIILGFSIRLHGLLLIGLAIRIKGYLRPIWQGCHVMDYLHRALFHPRVVRVMGFYCLLLSPFAWSTTNSEASLKAAFVYNFFKFAEWPESPNNGQLQLCLLNMDSPMISAFNQIQGRSIKNYLIQVRYLETNSSTENCHLVYMHDRLPNPSTVYKAVLTVGDTREFIQAGGMIGLFEYEGRLQFDINLVATTQAQIQLSSHLLKLARRVHQAGG